LTLKTPKIPEFATSKHAKTPQTSVFDAQKHLKTCIWQPKTCEKSKKETLTSQNPRKRQKRYRKKIKKNKLS
jgi:hypothetical protein